MSVFTRSLNSAISLSVIVLALAITEIKLTFVWSWHINLMSICFKLNDVSAMNHQDWRLKEETHECPVG